MTTGWTRCSECGEDAVGRIVYGMLSYESYLELGPGVVPGGCMVGSAVTECTHCEATWDNDGRLLPGNDGRRW